MTEAESSPVVVSVSNVRKYFGPTRALDGCSFAARAGEIHAIIGGNGCGKSTLAKVISGVLPIDGGSVSIFGEAPSTPAESRAAGIATVYQEVLVAEESPVVDNLYMGVDRLFSSVVPYEQKARNAAAIMQELAGQPVDPFAKVGALPLAIKQWITIGRALLSKPRILILDESSAALDFDSTQRLFAKMRDLRADGATILIVTHRIAELISISDRATVMRDGRDVGIVEKADLTEKNLIALMTGEAPEEAHPGRRAPRPAQREAVMRAHRLVNSANSAPFDFELYRGEIVGVAGLDGQGQSEFVRRLAGVQRPLGGEISALSRNGGFRRIDSLKAAVKERVVYVSGDRKREGIFASLSIIENMTIPLYREKRRGGVLGLIDWFSLGAIFAREAANLALKFGERDDKITSLSGGNQQKVLIGRGFALRPDIIVLNDPARGIDVSAKNELYKHLRAFAESGKSVVYMSSELEEFIGFATRVIVFRDGRPFDAFAGDEVEGHAILSAMFGQTSGAGLRHVAVDAAEPARATMSAALAADPSPAGADRAPAGAPPRPTIKIVEFGSRGEVVRRRRA
jgi:ribose transport system ATP-binding protein